VLPDQRPVAERVDVLMLLYPWYKDEVYRRRQQMIWLTVVGASALVLLLFLALALPLARPGHRVEPFLMAAGVLVLSIAMLSFIHQQYVRHKMAKGILITLEQALGLYEDGRYLNDTSLYPRNWQTGWLRDRSEFIYHSIILLLTALVVSALLR
jgi:lysylphosphatidylglycerol synthetase-like protein (DUF2156 family)